MSELRVAFKEWAVICRALAAGRQALILRKGGVAEDAGEFRVEHTRFWLYPTYVHQMAAGVQSGAAELLADAERTRPPAGTVRLSHWAEVVGVYHVRDIASALKLTDLHLWSVETVEKRFAYRAPGLYVLPVRVHRAPAAVEVVETAEYAGCKSWVVLEGSLPAAGSTPVQDDATFTVLLRELDRRLDPIAAA